LKSIMKKIISPILVFAKWLRTGFIKHHVILLSLFLPSIILEVAYAIQGIFPFGNSCLLIIDLYHQYTPFLSDLQGKYQSFSSLFYSWSGGLGTNYLPMFAYYIASPLNLLTVLFPKEGITEAILVLTLIKVGLAGGCFSLYLKGVHGKQNLVTVAFSLLYALSGYFLAYSWNIMWMDVIYLTPLLILGLVKLIRDGRGLLFCIILTAILFSNFYIAFFVCIFLVFYYPVCLFEYHSIRKPLILLKKTAQFAGWSLLSAGLASVLLLPTYFQLKLTSAADDLFPKSLTFYFDIFDYLSRHFTAAKPSTLEGMPSIYSGIVVLILIPIYFLSRSIQLKEKLLHTVLILFMILSFNINFLNFLWHGMHFPNQIPYRFSFVYIFLILTMGYKAFDCLKEFTGRQIGMICAAILSIILISQKFDDISLEVLTIYVSLVYIILYAAVLTLGRVKTMRESSKILFFLILVTAEITTNAILTINHISSIQGYTNRNGYASGTEVDQIRSRILDIEENDQDFYRMEVLPPKTTNDAFLYGYRGVSIFSSTISEKTVTMMKNLGYHSNGINSYAFESSTPVLDAFFGVKYLIYRSIGITENMYQKMPSTDELTVFTNPYALPPGFYVPAAFKDYRTGKSSTFNNQNNLMKSISGIDDIFTPIEQKQGTHMNLSINDTSIKYYKFTRPNKDSTSTARITFPIEKDEQVYLYYSAPAGLIGSGFVTVEGEKVNFNPKHSTLINLGYCRAGTVPELQVSFEKSSPLSGSFEVQAYTMDVVAFEKAIAVVKEGSMTVKSFSDTRIDGSITAKKDGLMIMTIPYDKGWTVKVDGEVVETRAIDECLLSFDLEQGYHDIEMNFVPDKFFIGLGISLISLLLLLVITLLKRLPKRIQARVSSH